MRNRFKPRVDKCIDCGAEYLRNSPNQPRCPECSEIRKAKKQKEAKRNYRKRTKPVKKNRMVINEPPSPFCTITAEILAAKRAETDTVCRRHNCAFWSSGSCNYILMVGRQRPSTVQNCTAYIKGKKRKKECIEEE